MIELIALLSAAVIVVATDLAITHLRRNARSLDQRERDGEGGRERRDTAP